MSVWGHPCALPGSSERLACAQCLASVCGAWSIHSCYFNRNQCPTQGNFRHKRDPMSKGKTQWVTKDLVIQRLPFASKPVILWYIFMFLGQSTTSFQLCIPFCLSFGLLPTSRAPLTTGIPFSVIYKNLHLHPGSWVTQLITTATEVILGRWLVTGFSESQEITGRHCHYCDL